MLRKWTIVLFLSGITACVHASVPETLDATAGAITESAMGVHDPALRRLLDEHWEASLRYDPWWATQVGDHRYDDQLAEVGGAARERRMAALVSWDRTAAMIGMGALSDSDQITLELFRSAIHNEQADLSCQFSEFAIGPTWTPVHTLMDIAVYHPVDSLESGKNLVARLGAGRTYIEASAADLRRGLAAGNTADAKSVQQAIDTLSKFEAETIDNWPGFEAVIAEHSTWSESDSALYREQLKTVFESWRPAIAAYRVVLEEILPHARPDELVGIRALPSGEACYARQIERHTTLPLAAETVHATGLAELQRIHAEMLVLGAKEFGTTDLTSLFERLRTEPSLRFDSEQSVEDAASRYLARAQQEVPKWFGHLPKTQCVVQRIPEFEAPYTYVAYYRPPHSDGSKPGEYFINTYAPETRLRHEAAALAFHEAVPGHHLQIALAQEAAELPRFRRHSEQTAFVEGWALYSERLAEEMGLYDTDRERLGRLSFESWRAARLVVDTGIHANGWSRAQAVKFFSENTPLAQNNIENEVDRYIRWPGQALGYKTGEMEIRRLRAEVEAALGDKFDIRAFHDVVLSGGAVTLPVLRARVEAEFIKQATKQEE